MRKNNLRRRGLLEAASVSFKNKELTFRRRKITGDSNLSAYILAMLYWGEGFKGNKDSKLTTVDFANSDPDMIRVFMKAFRSVYDFDERKLRVLLYCYKNQNIPSLINFWSRLTSIPKGQFTKPYINNVSGSQLNRMKYGLVHIRYNDKKLLLEMKNLIESIKSEYAPIV